MEFLTYVVFAICFLGLIVLSIEVMNGLIKSFGKSIDGNYSKEEKTSINNKRENKVRKEVKYSNSRSELKKKKRIKNIIMFFTAFSLVCVGLYLLMKKRK